MTDPAPTPSRPDTRRAYHDRVVRVLRHVQHHLDEPLTPRDLAQVAHVATHHFHRVFAGMVGETLAEHVRRLRLERAAGELRATDDSVLAIAMRAGYGAHESFTRAFKGHFGVTPRAYREAGAAEPFPAAPCGVHYGPDDAVGRFTPIRKEMSMLEVTTKELAPVRLAAIPHHGAYTKIGDTFGRLMGMAGPLGLLGPATLTAGVYYDDPESTPEDELRSYAGIVVEGDAPVPEGMEEVVLAGGKHIVATHRGSYANLESSYQWLMGQWMPEHSVEMAEGPSCEIYRNSPMTAAPEDLLTDIIVRVV